jgi:hypothetical protein
MPNNISVGVAFSDPALVAGTTIDGAVITGSSFAGSVAATTVNASTGLGMTSGTVAAAGTDNTNATAITTPGVLVTGGNGTTGAILPARAAGSVVFVKNGAAAILKIYPPSGAAINALTATTGAISLASNVSAIFWYYSATQVYTIPLLPS